MAALKTPEAMRVASSDGPKSRLSGTRPVPLVPVEGFQPIPAGDEAETTTTIEISEYATSLPNAEEEEEEEEDTDLRATISDASSSGLHCVRLPEIPVEVVEVEVNPDHSIRAEQPTLLQEEETETDRRPTADSVVRFKDDTTTETLPPVPVAELYGALETVPLSAALVRYAIDGVDARAAAKAAGLPPPPMGPPPPEMMAAPSPPIVPIVPIAPPPRAAPTTGRVGVEIAIAVITFVAVAGPAFWYLFLR